MSDKTLGAYERHEIPDPTRNADGRPYCAAERDEFACSRETGHTGPHVAAFCDLQNSICEVWDQAERHEKHDADDFARAEFARHPDGRVAARMVPKDDAGHQWLTADADATDLTGPDVAGYFDQHTDSGMAGGGWSPVRECPDPEQHDNETTHPGGLSASEWKILAESYGREMGSAREYAEETREFAALWKETAREHVRRARTALSYADAARLARAVAAVTPCSCSAQRARAEKAERERDEALRTLKEVLDSHDETLRDIASGKYAAEPRPLTPDAITDEMVERARERLREHGILGSLVPRLAREVLTAALIEPPARPEGAEEIEFLITDRLGGDVPGDVIRALADEIAERAGATRLYPEDGAA